MAATTCIVEQGDVTKICPKCHERKGSKAFHRDRRRPHGLGAICRSCKSSDSRAYRRTNPERIRAQYVSQRDALLARQRKRRASPEAKAKQSVLQKRWYGANREAVREYKVRIGYGLGREEHEARIQSQGGVCAVCKTQPIDKRSHIDHDHASGRVRGILCANCNHGLGKFRDEPALLRAAASYLESC